MHTGATDLPNSKKVLDAGTSPLVNQHTTAKVMCRRDHRNCLARDIESNLQTLCVDVRKAFANVVGAHVRCDVQHDVRVTMSFHFMMNRTGHNIASSKVLPFGSIGG